MRDTSSTERITDRDVWNALLVVASGVVALALLGLAACGRGPMPQCPARIITDDGGRPAGGHCMPPRAGLGVVAMHAVFGDSQQYINELSVADGIGWSTRSEGEARAEAISHAQHRMSDDCVARGFDGMYASAASKVRCLKHADSEAIMPLGVVVYRVVLGDGARYWQCDVTMMSDCFHGELPGDQW